MKRIVKKIFLIFILIAGACLAIPVMAGESVTASIDRESSERDFLRGYDYFLQNRLWNTLDSLAESISENVYFVDVYYMESLVQRRLGRYPDAIASMSRYLEVRRDDFRARIILDVMKSEWELIKSSLSSGGETPELAFEAYTINSFLSLPVYDPLSLRGMAGLGKISSSGDYIFVCDTLGGAVWMFDKKGVQHVAKVAVERPSTVMPITENEALVFLEDGSVYKMTVSPSREITLDEEPSLGGDIVDADYVDSTFFVAADRSGGYLRFAELPSMKKTVEWRPPDAGSDKLFEPVAVAAYGPLIAAADRGGGKIYVLDAYTLAQLDLFDVERPRDVAWGASGELYALSEKGTLYARYPVGAVSADVTAVADGVAEAWSMDWSDDSLLVTSVSARTWWKGQTNPGYVQTFGAISLHDPWIESVDETENLMLRGTVASTFQGFIQDKIPTTHVIWRSEVRPSRITSVGASLEGKARFYSPVEGKLPNGESVVPAGTLADVMRDIAQSSRGGEKIPRVIVLDSRITESEDETEQFLAFLLQQGVRLDIWALAKPASLLMSRVSKMTSGKTYFTRAIFWMPQNESTEWILSVPLPPNVTTFGYPSDTTLSLFSEIDMIRFSDWVPIWPSLLERGEGELRGE